MIPKSELKNRIAELEGQLAAQTKLISRFYPWAVDLLSLVKTLQKMGLERQTREIMMVGQAYTFDELTNPDTGDTVAAHYVKVSVEKNDVSGHYEVYVEGMPYAAYFQQEQIKKAELDRLAAENPMVKDLFEENALMKHILRVSGKEK